MVAPIRHTHRQIVERITITGVLRLESPAHFGSGEASDMTDMALASDELDGAALLPGTSLAGALRNYLRELQYGYPDKKPATENEPVQPGPEISTPRVDYASLLFGGEREDAQGRQSWVIVHDAPSQFTRLELRDGVKINPKTRTAEDNFKYDYELLSAGTEFRLRFELLLPAGDQVQADILLALATALSGLEKGEITLGKRKRRGFGRCSVHGWQVVRYRLDTPAGLAAWLAEDHFEWLEPGLRARFEPQTTLQKALVGNAALLPDQRKRLIVAAEFGLDGSLLVRSGFGDADIGPDVVHLRSLRPGLDGKPVWQPVLPGTSLAGALRARALRVATVVGGSPRRARKFVEAIFGPEKVERDDENTPASRLETEETVIAGGIDWIQNRVKIDRFTGGAFDGALFNEQPVFGASQTRINIRLILRQPSPGETGLLLLLLKDLWTGDLHLGGEASIGRGRLRGICASLSDGEKTWAVIQQEGGKVMVEHVAPATLEMFVTELKKELSDD